MIKLLFVRILLVFFLVGMMIESIAQSCPKRIATIEDNYVGTGVTIQSPQVAWMRKSLLAVDQMTRNNPFFTSIPDARLRNHLFAGIYYDDKAAEKIVGEINIVAYSKKGWDNTCGIIPQADRIAADEGFIGVGFNFVDRERLGSTELCPYHDEQLDAFYEPQSVGSMAGHTYYDIGYFNLVLLTYNGKTPWVPVTVNEYLNLTERKMIKDIASYRMQQKQNTSRQFNEAGALKYYEELKKTDPKKADEYLMTTQAMKKTMEENANQARKDSAAYEANWQKEFSDFKKFTASLTTAQLQQQAVIGGGNYHVCLTGTCDQTRRLVKLDPDFNPRLKDRRIKIICIRYIKTSKQAGWANLVRQTVESLDYKILQDLMK